MERKKRISVTIPVRSLGLKRFVEKAIKDDEFFRFALENPLGAMEECGVKLDAASLLPKDFAAFFGALAGVKEMVKKKNIKDLTFEGIFGRAADLRGTNLTAEASKGFYREWDKDMSAYAEKGILTTTESKFEASGEVTVEAQTKEDLSLEGKMRVDARFAGIAFADQKSETNSGSRTEWSNKDAMRETRSEEGWNKNFASLVDIFAGPLIYPEDLAALAARIKTFTEIAEEIE